MTSSNALDQVAWGALKTMVACGLRVGVRINKPEFMDRVLALIPSIWKPSSALPVERLFSLRVGTSGLRRNGRSLHQLYEDQGLSVECGTLDGMFEAFEKQLKKYLAEMARRRVFIHAGAVGWRGKAILIPGRSFSGKTSLVAALVRAGADYYSDEYAVLDKYGRVHPYPAPLAVRTDATFKQTHYAPEHFGGQAGIEPLPVGLVVVSQYNNASRWHPRQLTGGETVLELLNNTVPARRKPEAVLLALRQAVTQAVGLKSARGDAQETARLILSRLTHWQ